MAGLGEIRYARSGEASIAYRVCGEGPSDLLVIGGFVSNLEIAPELPRVRRFADRLVKTTGDGLLATFDGPPGLSNAHNR